MISLAVAPNIHNSSSRLQPEEDNKNEDEEEHQPHQHETNEYHCCSSKQRNDVLKSELLDTLSRLERDYNEEQKRKTSNHENKKKETKKQTNRSNSSIPVVSTSESPILVPSYREGGGGGIFDYTTSPGRSLFENWHDDDDDYYCGDHAEVLDLIKDHADNRSWSQFDSGEDGEEMINEEESKQEGKKITLDHEEPCFFLLGENDTNKEVLEDVRMSNASINQDDIEPFPAFHLFQLAYETNRAKCSQLLDAVRSTKEFLEEIQHQQEMTGALNSHTDTRTSKNITSKSILSTPTAISNVSHAKELDKGEDITRQDHGHNTTGSIPTLSGSCFNASSAHDCSLKKENANKKKDAHLLIREQVTENDPFKQHRQTESRAEKNNPLTSFKIAYIGNDVSLASHSSCIDQEMTVERTSSTIDVVLREIEQEAKQEEVLKKKRRIEIMRRRELLLSQERIDFVRKRSSVERIQRFARKILMWKLMKRYKMYRQGLAIVERIERTVLLSISLSSWKMFCSHKRSAYIILHCLRYHVITARKKRARKLKDLLVRRKKDRLVTKITDNCYVKLVRYAYDTWYKHIIEAKQLDRLQSIRRISAFRIQGFLRILVARKQLALLRVEAVSHSRSAVCIQSNWRMIRAKEKNRLLTQLKFEAIQNSAATKIQKFVRGSRIRRKFITILRTSKISIQDPELDAILDEDDIDNMLVDIASVDEGDIFSDCWVPSFPNLFNKHEATKSNDETSFGNVDETDEHNVLSTSHEGTILSQEQKLMDEWNITDKRVLESMIKRRNKMNKTKEKKERTKKLANPMTRFKLLMRRINGKT